MAVALTTCVAGGAANANRFDVVTKENGEKIMILDEFRHNGIAVEIRLLEIDDCFVVRATDALGTALNGYTYSVAKLQRVSIEFARTLDPIRELARIARQDVESGMWEKYLAAGQALAT